MQGNVKIYILQISIRFCFFNTYTATHHTAHKMGLFILSQSKKVIALANLSFFLFVLFFLPTPMRPVILSFIVDLWSFLSLSLNSPVRSKYMTKSLTPACLIITTCFCHSPACFYAPWLWKFPPAPQCGSASKCCFWRGKRDALTSSPSVAGRQRQWEREREERAARKKK